MTSGNETKEAKLGSNPSTVMRTYNVGDYYQILDKVGRGTYGTVYKAKGLKDGHFYAIKKLQNNDTKLQQQGFPITALREISLLKQIDHPNIIKLKEIIVSRPNKRNLFRGSTFLVFEYMDHDFAGLFKNKNKYQLPQTKAIMKQLLEGVAYLHKLKIMHRDIKSANILMNDQGCVKLADFGLGRKVRFENYFTYKVVTLWYRAPELLLGCKNYTDKIDVWSLGCVLVQFFTGEVLFRKQTEYAQMERIYEIVGDFQANDITVNDELLKLYQNYQDLRPKKTYPKEIASYLKKFYPQISDITIDFVERMLHLDPAKRMTCQQALRHPFFSEKPLACKNNQIKKQDYQCHQMFRDRAMKIVRSVPKKEENQIKPYRPKQQKDSRDYKDKESNGNGQQIRKQVRYHREQHERDYRPKDQKKRQERDHRHYEYRKHDKPHSEVFSSGSKGSRSESSSSVSSDYTSSQRSPRSRSRNNHRRGRDPRDERRYKDEYHHRERQDRKRQSRRDERKPDDKMYRERRDQYHRHEHQDRKYRDYHDDKKRYDIVPDRRKQYREDYDLSKKEKRPERRQDSIKRDDIKIEKRQERRSEKRDDRKEIVKQYHVREYLPESRQRRIDKQYKGGSTYESKDRKYHDQQLHRKQRWDDKHEKHSKDRFGDEKRRDYGLGDQGRVRDEPAGRDRYYVNERRGHRKKSYNSGSSERSPRMYKKESSRHQKSAHYQPKHYKKQHEGGYDHHNR